MGLGIYAKSAEMTNPNAVVEAGWEHFIFRQVDLLTNTKMRCSISIFLAVQNARKPLTLTLMPFGNYLPAQFFDLQAQRAADSSAQPIVLGSDFENRYAA